MDEKRTTDYGAAEVGDAVPNRAEFDPADAAPCEAAVNVGAMSTANTKPFTAQHISELRGAGAAISDLELTLNRICERLGVPPVNVPPDTATPPPPEPGKLTFMDAAERVTHRMRGTVERIRLQLNRLDKSF